MDLLKFPKDVCNIVNMGCRLQDNNTKKEIISSLREFISTANVYESFSIRYKKAYICITKVSGGLFQMDKREYFPQDLVNIVINILLAQDSPTDTKS